MAATAPIVRSSSAKVQGGFPGPKLSSFEGRAAVVVSMDVVHVVEAGDGLEAGGIAATDGEGVPTALEGKDGLVVDGVLARRCSVVDRCSHDVVPTSKVPAQKVFDHFSQRGGSAFTGKGAASHGLQYQGRQLYAGMPLRDNNRCISWPCVGENRNLHRFISQLTARSINGKRLSKATYLLYFVYRQLTTSEISWDEVSTSNDLRTINSGD